MFDFLHRRHRAVPPSAPASKPEGSQENVGASRSAAARTCSLRAPTASDEEERVRQVHTQSLTNSTRCLLHSIPLPSVTWGLECCSSWLTEARTFYMLSPTGEYILLQVAYTNSGWPIQASCQVSANFFDPNKASESVTGHAIDWRTCPRLKRPRARRDPQRGSDGHVTETVNHHGNKLQISDSRTALRIANMEMRLSGRACKGPRFTAPLGVLTDNNDASSDAKTADQEPYHFKLLSEGSILSVDLTLDCDCSALSFGDGNIRFGVDADDGLIHMKFIPGLRVRGTITVDGVPRPYIGHAFGVHQVQGVRPTQVATRWNCFLFIADSDNQDDGNQTRLERSGGKKKVGGKEDREGRPTRLSPQTSLFMLQLCTPSSYGSEVVNYGIYCERGQVEVMCMQGRATTFAPSRDSQSGYYVPAEFRLTWQGEDAGGRSFEAYCQTKPTTLVDRINLLELLPFMMRKIVETFVTRPYVYQWLDRAQVTIKRGLERGKGREQVLHGWLLNELSILNED